MKSLVLGLAALAALVAAPANAADMAVKVPAYVAPVFSWTGCYVGVHAGGGWQGSSYSSRSILSGVGALGGGQVGCNLQVRQFVIGVEGEFWGSTLSDRDVFEGDTGSRETRSRNRWDGTIAVRAGVTFDRAFIYGKLGVAWGKFDYTNDVVTAPGFCCSFTERGDAIFTGVLIGVGFEYALTDNWTTKFEYNYIDYGNKIVNFTDNCPGCGGVTTFSQSIKEIKQIAKIGLNYKFGYADAVVAKY
jgi:outer membrane immunogenic protein